MVVDREATRIAHIGPATLPVGYSFGGAVERRMVELAAAQLHRGDDVLVVSLAPEGDELRSEGPARAVPILDVACRTRRPCATWSCCHCRPGREAIPRGADVMTGAEWSV